MTLFSQFITVRRLPLVIDIWQFFSNPHFPDPQFMTQSYNNIQFAFCRLAASQGTSFTFDRYSFLNP